MEMDTRDYLKKALLDTQERVRDFMNYAKDVKDGDLQTFFRQYADSEAHQAQKLQEFIDSIG